MTLRAKSIIFSFFFFCLQIPFFAQDNIPLEKKDPLLSCKAVAQNPFFITTEGYAIFLTATTSEDLLKNQEEKKNTSLSWTEARAYTHWLEETNKCTDVKISKSIVTPLICYPVFKKRACSFLFEEGAILDLELHSTQIEYCLLLDTSFTTAEGDAPSQTPSLPSWLTSGLKLGAFLAGITAYSEIVPRSEHYSSLEEQVSLQNSSTPITTSLSREYFPSSPQKSVKMTDYGTLPLELALDSHQEFTHLKEPQFKYQIEEESFMLHQPQESDSTLLERIAENASQSMQTIKNQISDYYSNKASYAPIPDPSH